jgi:hypothetical protein
MAFTPVVILSNLKDVKVSITSLETPVWRMKLWNYPYVKHLPFMADYDDYNKYAISLENVVIDFIEYLRVYSMAQLRNTHNAWMADPNDPSIIYIHFINHIPSISFLSFKAGFQTGFSYKEPVYLGELKTFPFLQDFPAIEDSSDNLTYQKMKFASGNITIDNSAGMLDGLFELFGNDLTLLNYTGEQELEVIRQFFISSYTVGLKNAVFSVKDKRSRLTFKAPNQFYTREEYKFIEDNLVDKVKQDAYGRCFGVEGTCVNRNQVYINPAAYPLVFNDWFQYKFSRKITKVETIQVNINDVWTEVFPGLGIPGNNDYQSTNPYPVRLIYKDANNNDLTVNITASNMDNLGALYPTNDGRIAIWWSQALRDNPGYLERRNGNANKAKMAGIFVDKHTPGDIIKDMMVYYGELPYDVSYFDMATWDQEMAGGKNIGICLDRSDDIFSWIEKIQNGAMMGFQLLVYKNLFTARLDNPNRTETFDIKWQEIINRDELVPEMNGNNYATFTTINYRYDYADKEWLTVVDKSQRVAILKTYKFEKEYTNDSYLINEADVIKKGQIILENFMKARPIIRGIGLQGVREELKLYATGWIDFSVQIPRQMKIIQKYMQGRTSAGKIRVKIIGWNQDIKNEKTYIDVVQCDRLESLNDMYPQMEE